MPSKNGCRAHDQSQTKLQFFLLRAAPLAGERVICACACACALLDVGRACHPASLARLLTCTVAAAAALKRPHATSIPPCRLRRLGRRAGAAWMPRRPCTPPPAFVTQHVLFATPVLLMVPVCKPCSPAMRRTTLFEQRRFCFQNRASWAFSVELEVTRATRGSLSRRALLQARCGWRGAMPLKCPSKPPVRHTATTSR